METKEYYGGTYTGPYEIENEKREVEITCSFKTKLEVPIEYENYFEIKQYIEQNYTESEIVENITSLMIEDVEK